LEGIFVWRSTNRLIITLLLVGGGQQTFFLKGADCLSAYLEGNFFAVNNEGLGLQVRLPDFLGVALGKTDIAAELFALTGEFTFIHNSSIVNN